MVTAVYQEEPVRRYLLGYARPEEEEMIERRFFTDAGYVNAVEAIRYELTDEYVRGELSETEKRRFETGLLGSQVSQAELLLSKALCELYSGRDIARAAPPDSYVRGYYQHVRAVGAAFLRPIGRRRPPSDRAEGGPGPTTATGVDGASTTSHSWNDRIKLLFLRIAEWTGWLVYIDDDDVRAYLRSRGSPGHNSSKGAPTGQ